MAEVTFEIPNLLTRPVVGTSCCATTAEVAITQEFWMVGGVEDSRVDSEGGRVWVRFDTTVVSEHALREALGEIGYPPRRAESSL